MDFGFRISGEIEWNYRKCSNIQCCFFFGSSFIPRRMMYMQIYEFNSIEWTLNNKSISASCVKCYVLCVNRTHCFDWISSMCESQVPHQKEFINNNRIIWKSIFVTCFSFFVVVALFFYSHFIGLRFGCPTLLAHEMQPKSIYQRLSWFRKSFMCDASMCPYVNIPITIQFQAMVFFIVFLFCRQINGIACKREIQH